MILLRQSPNFWYDITKLNIFFRVVLYTCSRIYYFFYRLLYSRPYKYVSDKSLVIAVGGLTVGGSGKTVVVSYLIEKIRKNGLSPAVLSRGYGRKSNVSRLVDYIGDTCIDVGDEPLLLSKKAVVAVDKNRYKSLNLVECLGYNVVILDDGLCQRYLKPDVYVLVIDALQCIGNGELLPLGPNRMLIDLVKDTVDIVYVINSSKQFTLPGISQNKIRYLKVTTHVDGVLEQERIFVFCAIGYPEKFKRALLKNYDVVGFLSYPDHYLYTCDDIDFILGEAYNLSVTVVVTTEKDFMRVPLQYRSRITVAKLRATSA